MMDSLTCPPMYMNTAAEMEDEEAAVEVTEAEAVVEVAEEEAAVEA
jgi:hypothetical protein